MKKGFGSGAFLVILIISVLVVVLLAVWSAKQDVAEVEKIKQAEVIQEQKTEELGDAMQGIKADIEQGYEDLDSQISE